VAQSTAPNGDERLLAAGAAVVQGARGQLLAGAGRTAEQDRGQPQRALLARQPVEQVEGLAHDRAAADHALEPVLGPQLHLDRVGADQLELAVADAEARAGLEPRLPHPRAADHDPVEAADVAQEDRPGVEPQLEVHGADRVVGEDDVVAVLAAAAAEPAAAVDVQREALAAIGAADHLQRQPAEAVMGREQSAGFHGRSPSSRAIVEDNSGPRRARDCAQGRVTENHVN
jgi:hypothetical protein